MIRPIVFGKFCLLERISVGGMAEVYRAKLLNAPHFNRFLAIKRILPNLAADNEFISMFIDEAKITVELNHPNICQIYELGRLENAHYIVMEYIPGRDLLAMQNRYRRQKKIMSVSQACFITAQVAQGLDYAHRAVDSQGNPLRIIHRDVSPQNMLVSYEGLIKLIDFGVARAASKNSKTQAGVLKGKFGYMSPEQVNGKPIDHRSDIFALGTVMWELLTGRRLFHADHEFATLELVRNCEIRPPSELNKLVPPQIETIVMKALCPDPAYRYQWAGEMARDIWLFLNSCNPPYTQWHLQNWMCTNFQEDLEEEWEKLPVFQSINSAADVKRYNQEQLAKHQAEMQAEMQARQQIRDFEGNIVPELEDMEDFQGENTQVFTPEFNFDSMPAEEEDEGSALPDLPAPAAEISNPSLQPKVGETPTENPLHASVYQMDVVDYGAGAGRGGIILAVLIALVVIGGAGFAVYWFALRTPESTAATEEKATAEITVTPASAGVTYKLLDGSGNVVANGTGSKGTLADVEPGKYTLQVEHPDYETEQREIALTAGPSVVQIDMLRPKLKTGVVNLTVEPSDATVLVSGEPLEGQGAARALELEAGKEHTLTVQSPGYKTFSTTIPVAADEQQELAVTLEKGEAIITVRASPKGEAFIYNEEEDDWESLGDTTARAKGLDATRTYKIEVRRRGYVTAEKTIEFSTEVDDDGDGVYRKTAVMSLTRK